ncbi:hypothetical protein ODZ83_05465 [Acaricomes phytoseiuli]|nr:hypothetical protein [Acaricomes phytoseiuli]MCW1249639.1 hypothetical protein [Acaricomes phytoseiuli]
MALLPPTQEQVEPNSEVIDGASWTDSVAAFVAGAALMSPFAFYAWGWIG